MKKNLFIALIIALNVVACKEAPKKAASEAETTVAAPATNDTLMAMPTEAPNPISKAAFVGTWQSTIDKKNVMTFKDGATDSLQTYVVHYDKKLTEEANWKVPATCKGCLPAAPDGCFFFMAEDGEDCCSIVKLTADSLQYIVLGSTGKIQSFVKVKK